MVEMSLSSQEVRQDHRRNRRGEHRCSDIARRVRPFSWWGDHHTRAGITSPPSPCMTTMEIMEVSTKAFVDASGDGDLAFLAEPRYVMGTTGRSRRGR
jgi:hypothetical protein